MNTDRIEKKVLLHAPRARVWRALSDSAEFGTWFGVKFDGPFAPGACVRGAADEQPASPGRPARGHGAGLARSPRILELGAARDTGGHSGLPVGDQLAGEVIVHLPSPIPTMRRPVSTGCPQHRRTTPCRSVTPPTPTLSPRRHPTTRQSRHLQPTKKPRRPAASTDVCDGDR